MPAPGAEDHESPTGALLNSCEGRAPPSMEASSAPPRSSGGTPAARYEQGCHLAHAQVVRSRSSAPRGMGMCARNYSRPCRRAARAHVAGRRILARASSRRARRRTSRRKYAQRTTRHWRDGSGHSSVHSPKSRAMVRDHGGVHGRWSFTARVRKKPARRYQRQSTRAFEPGSRRSPAPRWSIAKMHAFSAMAPLLYAILLTTTMVVATDLRPPCGWLPAAPPAPPASSASTAHRRVAADASFFGPHPQFFTTALPSPQKLTHVPGACWRGCAHAGSAACADVLAAAAGGWAATVTPDAAPSDCATTAAHLSEVEVARAAAAHGVLGLLFVDADDASPGPRAGRSKDDTATIPSLWLSAAAGGAALSAATGATVAAGCALGELTDGGASATPSAPAAPSTSPTTSTAPPPPRGRRRPSSPRRISATPTSTSTSAARISRGSRCPTPVSATRCPAAATRSPRARPARMPSSYPTCSPARTSSRSSDPPPPTGRSGSRTRRRRRRRRSPASPRPSPRPRPTRWSASSRASRSWSRCRRVDGDSSLSKCRRRPPARPPPPPPPSVSSSPATRAPALLHVCDVPSAMPAYSHGLAEGEALEATPSECVAHAHFGGAAGAVVAVAAARSELPSCGGTACTPILALFADAASSLALTVTAPSPVDVSPLLIDGTPQGAIISRAEIGGGGSVQKRFRLLLRPPGCT